MAERRTAQKAACEAVCEVALRLDKQINGNGQPGIRQELQALANEAHDFFSRTDERAKVEMAFHNKRDKEIREKLEDTTAASVQATADLSLKISRKNLWISIAAAVATFAGVAVAIAAIAITLWVSHHAGLNPFIEIPRNLPPAQVYTAHSNAPQISEGSRPSW